MSMSTGHYGAKVQSFRKTNVNPRALVRELLDTDDSLKKDRSRAFRLFSQAIDDSALVDDYVTVLKEYFFTNTFNSLISETPTTIAERSAQIATGKQETQKAASGMMREAKKLIQEKVQELYLTHVMPNGKEARDCDRRYLRKHGGVWIKLSEKLTSDRQLLGAVVKTEAQVRKILQK